MGKNKLPLARLKIVLIYLMAFLPVYLLFYFNVLTPSLINVLIADIIATAVVFAFSAICNNSSVYDPYWSVVPPIVVIYFMILFPEGNTVRQLIILAVVLFWSIRLTVNWLRGWTGFEHQDWRYNSIAKKTGKMYWPVSFLGIHLMPTLLVFLGCMPLWYSISSTAPLNIFDVIVALFTFGAVLVEWQADEQLIRFRKKGIKNSYLNTGLWSISRHPNYLGEICFWIGLFLFVLSSTKLEVNDGYWTSVGLVSMLLLFYFISVPMMEKRNLERKPEYGEYIKQVSAIFPLHFKRKV
jgi:steroid 5-alpha reductase family enzyme